MTENPSAAFTLNIASAAERIEKLLASDGEITAWDIKMRLRLSSSLLYMALGWLCSQGKAEFYPEELTYRVKAVPSQPIKNETQPVS